MCCKTRSKNNRVAKEEGGETNKATSSQSNLNLEAVNDDADEKCTDLPEPGTFI